MNRYEYRKYPSTVLEVARVGIGNVVMQALFTQYEVPAGGGLLGQNEANRVTDFSVKRLPVTKKKAILDTIVPLTHESVPTTCYRMPNLGRFTAYDIGDPQARSVTTKIHVPSIFADEHFFALNNYARATHETTLSIADKDSTQRTIAFQQDQRAFLENKNLLLRELVCAANGLLILDQNI